MIAGRLLGQRSRRRVIGVRHDLGVHAGLADPAGDQLGVLGAEVDDQDGVRLEAPGLSARCAVRAGSVAAGVAAGRDVSVGTPCRLSIIENAAVYRAHERTPYPGPTATAMEVRVTVLIDPPRWPAHGRVWSHLVSDESYDELHAFAARERHSRARIRPRPLRRARRALQAADRCRRRPGRLAGAAATHRRGRAASAQARPPISEPDSHASAALPRPSERGPS